MYDAAYTLIYLSGRPRSHGAICSFVYLLTRVGLIRDRWEIWHPTADGVMSPSLMLELAGLVHEGFLVETDKGLDLPPDPVHSKLYLVDPDWIEDPIRNALRLYFS